MRLTEEEIKQIIKEEFANLVNEEEIDEKLLSALKGIGKGLYNKAADFMRGKPNPNASGGVGTSYARYKVPQKQPMGQPEPEIEPGSALVRRDAPQGMQTSVPDAQQTGDYKGAPFGSSYSVDQPGQLGTGQSTDSAPQDVKSSGDFPPPGPSQKQLPAPKLIGVAEDYGVLQSSVNDSGYSYLLQRVASNFFNSDARLKNLPKPEKNKYSNDINSVLKYLVATNRVLSNSTIVPKDIPKDIPKEKTVQEIENRPEVPSTQQAGLEPWYIDGLINTTKRHFSNSINDKLIEFVITTLYQDGRIAISRRMYNKLLHTNDPRIAQQNLEDVEKSLDEHSIRKESKSYNNFYNNWKRYTKPGVKI